MNLAYLTKLRDIKTTTKKQNRDKNSSNTFSQAGKWISVNGEENASITHGFCKDEHAGSIFYEKWWKAAGMRGW